MFKHLNISLPNATAKTVNKKRFYFTESGGVFPSITTVLGATQRKKKWLKEWRASVGYDVADYISRTSAARGTAFHKICEDYINNSDTEHHKQKFLPWCMFTQLKPVLDENLNNIHLQEQAMWSEKYRVAGRVDCIGEWKGVLSVIDFKTSKSERNDEYNTDYYIQGSAYTEMYEEMTGTEINQVVILTTTEDGTVQEFVKEKKPYLQLLVETIDEFTSQWEKENEEISVTA